MKARHRSPARAPACVVKIALAFAASMSFIVVLASSVPAQAATLTGPVGGPDAGASGYTTANVPSYVAMYEYVPDTLAADPPVLVALHWYGATAAEMFGVASQLVAAADKYGFIMVFPQNNNGGCWDISSTQSLTHDGGGESQAIAEMVQYEVVHRGANPNRAYVTGQSCGAMMTEVMLGVYPDVFKAGSEFSGVPVGGCWTCTNGYVDHTPTQWGAIVDACYPGYSGYRPRVQLWHGNADMTVNYQNQIEAIKEWTDVLGLSQTPTSTTMLTFNGYMFTREVWNDACGSAVLDAWTEQNGPHNTDVSENSTYVIPFLGLDVVGPVDPDLAACDAGSAADAAAVDAALEADTSQGDATAPRPDASIPTSATDAGSHSSSSAAGASTLDSSSSGASASGSHGSSGDASSPSSADTSSGSSAGATSAGRAGCGCSVPSSGGNGGAVALAFLSLLGVAIRVRRRPSGPCDR